MFRGQATVNDTIAHGFLEAYWGRHPHETGEFGSLPEQVGYVCGGRNRTVGFGNPESRVAKMVEADRQLLSWNPCHRVTEGPDRLHGLHEGCELRSDGFPGRRRHVGTVRSAFGPVALLELVDDPVERRPGDPGDFVQFAARSFPRGEHVEDQDPVPRPTQIGDVIQRLGRNSVEVSQHTPWYCANCYQGSRGVCIPTPWGNTHGVMG